jgi:hypothetical protein
MLAAQRRRGRRTLRILVGLAVFPIWLILDHHHHLLLPVLIRRLDLVPVLLLVHEFHLRRLLVRFPLPIRPAPSSLCDRTPSIYLLRTCRVEYIFRVAED